MVILPLIALIVAWFMTRDMERVYDTNTTQVIILKVLLVLQVEILRPTSPT